MLGLQCSGELVVNPLAFKPLPKHVTPLTSVIGKVVLNMSIGDLLLKQIVLVQDYSAKLNQ